MLVVDLLLPSRLMLSWRALIDVIGKSKLWQF
jgi:hypothetical protein